MARSVPISVLSRFNNLKTVFILQVVLPVFLLIGLILALTLGFVGYLAEERLQRDLQQIARAIQLPLASALEGNDMEQLNASLASVFEISEVYGAYLFDTDGRRLVSFGSVNPSRQQTDRAVRISVAGEQEFDLYEEIRGEDVYSFFLPLYDTGGQPSGLLQVTRLRSDIEQQLEQLRRRAWLGFSITILLAMACLILTHQRSVGRPLNRILRSMQRVEAGERTHRADLQGPEELRQLGQGLNTMLDAIEAAQHEARAESRQRERVSEQLRHAETMAALGQISAGVAHELGAPLSVVDGRALRLLRRLESGTGKSDSAEAQAGTPEISELHAIREQVQRMSTLVQQLLSFGRSSRASYTTYSLSAVFGHLQEQGLLDEWQIQVRPGQALRISTDLFSLEQALVNLFRNARQACPEGEVHAGWESTEDGQVVIFVEDSGPGIDPGIKNQLFDPFVTTKAPGEGSGMGLAIVQRVARDHQGEVRFCDSELGGVRFELILPQSGEAA